ncbi:MAG: hypothetical protein IPJ65_10605 [Archangiaceae bacterium]|nr:hypothetical protein [Archangiaceae bacterium]
MPKRRLALSALSFAACSSPGAFDAGTLDSGRPDAGRTDAGRTDAGYDAGTDAGSGCPCVSFRTGRCLIPADFPPDAGQFLVEEACDCQFIPVFVCPDETDLRCPSWACHPRREEDGGGVALQEDGGFECLC